MKAAPSATVSATTSADAVVRGLELAHNKVEIQIFAIRNTVLALQEASHARSGDKTSVLDWASLMDGLLSMLPEEEDLSDAVDCAIRFVRGVEATTTVQADSFVEPSVLASIIRVACGEETSEVAVDAGQAQLCEWHAKHGKAFAPAIASYLRAVQRHAVERAPEKPQARPRSAPRKREKLSKAAHAT